MRRSTLWMAALGAAAGMVTGLFGAGGGMILVPLLTRLNVMEEREIFPTSISVILPICVIVLALQVGSGLPWRDALPYMIGSAAGGIGAGIWGKRIPTIWLHRALGALILWGGLRYLWR